MKVAILFCLLALAFAEKRMLLDDIIDTHEVQNILDAVSEKWGTDATEADCEQECHALLKNDIVELFGCPFACKQIETALKKIHSKPTPPTVPVPTE